MRNDHRSLLGIVAVAALALAPAACSERETREAKEQSKETADKAAAEAKEAGRKIGAEAKEAGEKLKEGAKDAVSELDAKKQTVDVKTALMADKTIDASHIDVDTSADTKTVTLKGSVPTAAQKAAAERVARDKAEGYRVRNQLTVASR